MKNQEDAKKELRELSPLLAKLKAEQQPLEIPENYFEALPDQIWEQIRLMPQPERPTPRPGVWERLQNVWQTLLQPRIAISLATFAILIVVGIFLLKPDSAKDSANMLSGLSAEEVTAYMVQNLHEFDTELLIEAAAAHPDMSILSGSEFNEEEIEQLIDEVVKDLDEETLEELL